MLPDRFIYCAGGRASNDEGVEWIAFLFDKQGKQQLVFTWIMSIHSLYSFVQYLVCN